jgi:uncharacterized protein YhhL (DUF1145 family)
MSVAKILLLVVYAVLAVSVLTQGDTAAGVWSLRILVVLAAAHLVETIVFFKLCKEAQGSLVGNLAQVFVFGVLHANELKVAQAKR